MTHVLELVASRVPPTVLRWLGRAQFRVPLLRPVIRRASRSLTGRATTIAHGEGAGLRINAGPSNPGYALGTTELVVQRFVAQNLTRGDVFWDVGANVGFFTLIAARTVGPAGLVVAVEPSAGNIALLRENLRLNGFETVLIEEAAAAAESGRAPFLARESQDSRLFEPDEQIPADAPTVPTLALDELGHRPDFRPPRLVKIDAEGSELDVLRGMARVVRDHRPLVVCELHLAAPRREFVPRIEAALGAEAYDVRLLEGGESRGDRLWVGHVAAVPRA